MLGLSRPSSGLGPGPACSPSSSSMRVKGEDLLDLLSVPFVALSSKLNSESLKRLSSIVFSSGNVESTRFKKDGSLLLLLVDGADRSSSSSAP